MGGGFSRPTGCEFRRWTILHGTVPLRGTSANLTSLIVQHIGFGHKGRVSFNLFVRAKIEVQDKVVNAGFHLLFSDVDVVWTENALPELLSYPKQGYFMKEADEYAKTPKCVALPPAPTERDDWSSHIATGG